MSIHDSLARVADGGRSELERLYRRHDTGDLDFNEFLALAVTDGTRRSEAAASLASLAVAMEASRAGGELRPPTAPEWSDDPVGTVRMAVMEQTTTQSYALDPAAAMGICGAAVVMAAYQEATNRAMRDQQVEFYRREVEPDACEICADMADIILPVSHDQWHHKGCQCVAVPVSVKTRSY